MLFGKITPEEFLTIQTAQGLRVTISSTIDLSTYLLKFCGYEYVLTGKMCQDPLEVIILNIHIIIYLYDKIINFLINFCLEIFWNYKTIMWPQ